jgi:hypothetical protein
VNRRSPLSTILAVAAALGVPLGASEGYDPPLYAEPPRRRERHGCAPYVPSAPPPKPADEVARLDAAEAKRERKRVARLAREHRARKPGGAT